MTNVRVPKMLMEWIIGGKRRKGRPKARWKVEVEKDLQQLQTREWKDNTQDRTKWRCIVHKAIGLQSCREFIISEYEHISKNSSDSCNKLIYRIEAIL
ncbi:hypothetical protein NQ315_003231 [Exocentrus adspersus]|uniref:Uncharacterized protein n=1 Tax=Exocentrus adspersus TaxID=1586481 RepID=A0AAV8VMG6_9CUCU|nr:hypothetical protein NQ315_003231 [Exocentrus adspersus]